MFYIRKFTKASSVSKIKIANDAFSVVSDVLKDEFKTNENTLSFWKCEDINNRDETINAVLLSASDIDSTTFIILTDEQIKTKGICIDDSQPGKTGYKDAEKLHVNFCKLNIKQIVDLIDLYKQSIVSPNMTFYMKASDVKNRIKTIKSEGKYIDSKVDLHLKEKIENL